MAMYILSIAAQLWLSSAVLGDTACYNSIYTSNNNLMTYNFTCSSYCCSSSNSYKYCCSDCSYSFYKVDCSTLSPWTLGLIIFGCVVFLLIILPAIAMAATKHRRVVRPIVIDRDNSEDSDSDSAIVPSAASMPPPPPSYSAQPPPQPAVPSPAVPKSPRHSISSIESISTDDRPPSAMMPGSPPPFYTSRPATAVDRHTALSTQSIASAREQPAETRVSFDVDVNRSIPSLRDTHHEENPTQFPPEYSSDSQPSRVSNQNDESTCENNNNTNQQMPERTDVTRNDSATTAEES